MAGSAFVHDVLPHSLLSVAESSQPSGAETVTGPVYQPLLFFVSPVTT